MTEVMPFEKFEYVMKQIQEYEAKKDRISDFLEKEICSDSYCFFNVGEDLAHTLTCFLADEFNCWYNCNYVNPAVDELKNEIGIEPDNRTESTYPKWWDKSVRSWDNDIEYWLYEDSKKIIIHDIEIPISTLEEFYNYLIKYCVDKN